MRFAILIFVAALAHAQRVPVLAELFTSEGCSSCPPADQLLQKFDQLQPVPGAQVIVLSEHVDYWDRLGWRDPFSSPKFTARQERYARVLRSEVYTPQLVIDGRAQALGSDGYAVKTAIAQAAKSAKIPIGLRAVRDRSTAVVTIRFDRPPSGRDELWIAIADESDRSSVARGENAGHALTHVAVVRTLQSAGRATTAERTLSFEVSPAESRVVAFLTDPSGVVTGAAMAALP